MNGIIDSMDGRQKRQVYKDMTRLWKSGVFYDFDEGIGSLKDGKRCKQFKLFFVNTTH